MPGETRDETEAHVILGTTLLKMAGDPYEGIAFPRGTLNGVFAVQVDNVTAGASLNIDVETRNRSDTGWTLAGSFAPIGASGVFSLQVNGLREIVRLKYTVGGPATSSGMHVFMLTPQWLVD